MRETFRQTYTSLEIGMLKEENELLKRRLEKAIWYINDTNNLDSIDKNIILDILKGE